MTGGVKITLCPECNNEYGCSTCFGHLHKIITEARAAHESAIGAWTIADAQRDRWRKLAERLAAGLRFEQECLNDNGEGHELLKESTAALADFDQAVKDSPR